MQWLCVLLSMAGCADYVTPDELRERLSELRDQRVTVRGWAVATFSQTLVGCSDNDPCCNEASARLGLSAERPVLGRPSTNGVALDLPTCKGNECEVECTPFSPVSGPAFQIVGTLRQIPEWLPPYDLKIEAIDVAASLVLTGNGDLGSLDEQPIAQGTYKLGRDKL